MSMQMMWSLCWEAAPTPLSFAIATPWHLMNMTGPTSTQASDLYHDFEKRATHLWMLDYVKCEDRAMSSEGIAQAVKEAENHDPYFPKTHKNRPEDQDL